LVFFFALFALAREIMARLFLIGAYQLKSAAIRAFLPLIP
jgi:hypothetical protein